jgi:hypothetical protein
MAAKLILDEKTWKVKTEGFDDGTVDIKLVLGHDEWYLFKLKCDGTFGRYEYIDQESGLKLSKNGRIKESKSVL